MEMVVLVEKSCFGWGLSIGRYYFMETSGCHSERQRRIFIVEMLHFVQHDSEEESYCVTMIFSMGRAVLVEKLRLKCCLSIGRVVLMEKSYSIGCLSMGRRHFMEKLCLMLMLSMGMVVLVEKREIAGQAGNDGGDGMTERSG